MSLLQFAKDIFLGTLAEMDIQKTMAANVSCDRGQLRVGEVSYPLADFERIAIIAIGKAAGPMSDALLDILAPHISDSTILQGLVVSTTSPAVSSPALGVLPSAHGVRDPHLRYLPGAHPLPTLESRAAAHEVLALLSTFAEETLVLFLISGGASAMVEAPLEWQREAPLEDRHEAALEVSLESPREASLESQIEAGSAHPATSANPVTSNPAGPAPPTIPAPMPIAISIEDISSFYRALVHSGLPIVQMNCLRKHLSAVKGGRLAAACPAATQCTLLISDVPTGALHMVGSGPSMPDPSSVADCRRILATPALRASLPPAILAFFDDPLFPETPKPGDEAFAKSQYLALMSSDDLLSHAAEIASRAGFHVVIDNACDDWEYAAAADYLLSRIHALRKDHPRVCLLSAGEISVPLTAAAGRGGRNQQFALACALRLSQPPDQRPGQHASQPLHPPDQHSSLHPSQYPEQVTVLSAGTDGIDGNSPATGAVVDNSTCADAVARGLDPKSSFEAFDSFSLFEATGNAILTGPTGNNLRDLRILLSR